MKQINYIVNKKNIRNGFTLVELIVYITLLSIFLIVMTQIFVSILEVSTESEATSAVEQDSRFILSRFDYDITRSNSINVPDTNTLKLIISSETYTYTLASGNLILTTSSGSENINSSSTIIANLNFQKIGNPAGKDTVQINFTLNSETVRPAGPETRSYQTTIGIR